MYSMTRKPLTSSWTPRILVPAPRGPELRLWVGMRDSAAPKQPLVNGCAAITRNKSNILKQCGEKAALCSSFTCLKAPPLRWVWVGVRDSAAPKQPLINECTAITLKKRIDLKRCDERRAATDMQTTKGCAGTPAPDSGS